MIKIVQDVEVPGQWQKLSDMGYGMGMPRIMQTLIARFVNESECAEFMKAYNAYHTDDEPDVIHITGPEEDTYAYKVGNDT